MIKGGVGWGSTASQNLLFWQLRLGAVAGEGGKEG